MNGDLVRPDIPSPEDRAELIDLQDEIVACTAQWTDEITGPLLYVGEADLVQLPLSASRCRVRAPGSQPYRPSASSFVCRGISARETRNQVVLASVEWFVAEFAKDGNSLPTRQHQLQDSARPTAQEHPMLLDTKALGANLFIGAGWSARESIYRATSHASLGWASAAPPASWRPVSTERAAETPLGRYFLGSLSDAGCRDVQLQAVLAPLGCYVATASSGKAPPGLGTGIDERQASLNALLALSRGQLVPESSRDDQVVSAHLVDTMTTWSAALARIAAAASARTLCRDVVVPPFTDSPTRRLHVTTIHVVE
jgi:hypothetical protein